MDALKREGSVTLAHGERTSGANGGEPPHNWAQLRAPPGTVQPPSWAPSSRRHRAAELEPHGTRRPTGFPVVTLTAAGPGLNRHDYALAGARFSLIFAALPVRSRR